MMAVVPRYIEHLSFIFNQFSCLAFSPFIAYLTNHSRIGKHHSTARTVLYIHLLFRNSSVPQVVFRAVRDHHLNLLVLVIEVGDNVYVADICSYQPVKS
jgi:hypothetical protein